MRADRRGSVARSCSVAVALAFGVFVTTSGCATPQVRSAPVKLAPLPVDAIPAGTLAVAQTRQPLSTESNRAGDRFTAELLDPLIDSGGHVVVPRGTLVEGVVEGPARGGSTLQLGLVGLRTAGEATIPLPAEVAASPVGLEPAWQRGALGLFLGAAAGAGTGLAVERDTSGVILGATIVGASLGAVLGYISAGRSARLPAGSVITLRITRDFTLDPPLARDGRRRPVRREPLGLWPSEEPPPCLLPEDAERDGRDASREERRPR